MGLEHLCPLVLPRSYQICASKRKMNYQQWQITCRSDLAEMLVSLVFSALAVRWQRACLSRADYEVEGLCPVVVGPNSIFADHVVRGRRSHTRHSPDYLGGECRSGRGIG